MRTLDEIALETNTDRSSRFHDFCRTYDEFLTPIRHDPVKILEMGILGGDGLLMWSRYFSHPSTQIIGIDIETFRCQKIDDPRVSVCEDSQADPNFWKRCDDRSFDVIISDASHFASQEQASFSHGWHKVKPGGFYCIEDLHVWFSPQHCDAPENVMQWLSRIALELQGRGADASGRVEATDRWCDLDTITFRKGLCVIRKR